MPGNNLKFAEEFAKDYDNSISENNWKGPEVIYKLIKDRLEPNSKVLDLGIGTGESSVRFQEEGHLITGLDESKNMIKECIKKGISSELFVHDLEKTPYPFDNKCFDAVISNGVFHLIYLLKSVFSETKRILKPKGIFVFTYESAKNLKVYKQIEPGIWVTKTKSEILTYKHADEYIAEQAVTKGFEIVDQTRFLAFTNKEQQKEIYFTAIVAKQRGNR